MFKRFKMLLILVSLIMLAFPVVALASGPAEVPDVDLGPITDYVAAVGVGTIITLAVEILKRLGAVPDGQAGTWSVIANLVAFTGLYIGGVFGFDPTGEAVQNVLAILEQVGKLVLMIISSLGSFRQLRSANVFKPLPARSP